MGPEPVATAVRDTAWPEHDDTEVGCWVKTGAVRTTTDAALLSMLPQEEVATQV